MFGGGSKVRCVRLEGLGACICEECVQSVFFLCRRVCRAFLVGGRVHKLTQSLGPSELPTLKRIWTARTRKKYGVCDGRWGRHVQKFRQYFHHTQRADSLSGLEIFLNGHNNRFFGALLAIHSGAGRKGGPGSETQPYDINTQRVYLLRFGVHTQAASSSNSLRLGKRARKSSTIHGDTEIPTI